MYWLYFSRMINLIDYCYVNFVFRHALFLFINEERKNKFLLCSWQIIIHYLSLQQYASISFTFEAVGNFILKFVVYTNQISEYIYL